MSGFRRRSRKKVFILAAAVVVVAISAFLVVHLLNLRDTSQVPGTGTSTKPSKNDVGIYLDKGDLWQWVNGRKTQMTKLGTVSAFDWHPAGGEIVYVTNEVDGSFKLVDRKLASKQELVIQQGTAEIRPKVLCTPNSVLLVQASPTTVARLIQLTVTSMGYDGTVDGSFWTQVPVTKDQFDRTTWLILDGSTPLLVSPGGIWTIDTSSLCFDTAHTFLSASGVTFGDGAFVGIMQTQKAHFWPQDKGWLHHQHNSLTNLGQYPSALRTRGFTHHGPQDHRL